LIAYSSGLGTMVNVECKRVPRKTTPLLAKALETDVVSPCILNEPYARQAVKLVSSSSCYDTHTELADNSVNSSIRFTDSDYAAKTDSRPNNHTAAPASGTAVSTDTHSFPPQETDVLYQRPAIGHTNEDMNNSGRTTSPTAAVSSLMSATLSPLLMILWPTGYTPPFFQNQSSIYEYSRSSPNNEEHIRPSVSVIHSKAFRRPSGKIQYEEADVKLLTPDETHRSANDSSMQTSASHRRDNSFEEAADSKYINSNHNIEELIALFLDENLPPFLNVQRTKASVEQGAKPSTDLGVLNESLTNKQYDNTYNNNSFLNNNSFMEILTVNYTDNNTDVVLPFDLYSNEKNVFENNQPHPDVVKKSSKHNGNVGLSETSEALPAEMNEREISSAHSIYDNTSDEGRIYQHHQIVKDNEFTASEIENKVKKAVKNKVKNDVEDKVTNEVEDKVKNDYEDEVKNEVEDKAKNKVMDNVKKGDGNKVKSEIENKLNNEVENKVKNKVEDKVNNEFEDKGKNEVKYKVKSELEDKEKNEVKDKVNNELEAELKNTSNMKMKYSDLVHITAVNLLSTAKSDMINDKNISNTQDMIGENVAGRAPLRTTERTIDTVLQTSLPSQVFSSTDYIKYEHNNSDTKKAVFAIVPNSSASDSDLTQLMNEIRESSDSLGQLVGDRISRDPFVQLGLHAEPSDKLVASENHSVEYMYVQRRLESELKPNQARLKNTSLSIVTAKVYQENQSDALITIGNKKALESANTNRPQPLATLIKNELGQNSHSTQMPNQAIDRFQHTTGSYSDNSGFEIGHFLASSKEYVSALAHHVQVLHPSPYYPDINTTSGLNLSQVNSPDLSTSHAAVDNILVTNSSSLHDMLVTMGNKSNTSSLQHTLVAIGNKSLNNSAVTLERNELFAMTSLLNDSADVTNEATLIAVSHSPTHIFITTVLDFPPEKTNKMHIDVEKLNITSIDVQPGRLTIMHSTPPAVVLKPIQHSIDDEHLTQNLQDKGLFTVIKGFSHAVIENQTLNNELSQWDAYENLGAPKLERRQGMAENILNKNLESSWANRSKTEENNDVAVIPQNDVWNESIGFEVHSRPKKVLVEEKYSGGPRAEKNLAEIGENIPQDDSRRVDGEKNVTNWYDDGATNEQHKYVTKMAPKSVLPSMRVTDSNLEDVGEAIQPKIDDVFYGTRSHGEGTRLPNIGATLWSILQENEHRQVERTRKEIVNKTWGGAKELNVDITEENTWMNVVENLSESVQDSNRFLKHVLGQRNHSENHQLDGTTEASNQHDIIDNWLMDILMNQPHNALANETEFVGLQINHNSTSETSFQGENQEKSDWNSGNTNIQDNDELHPLNITNSDNDAYDLRVLTSAVWSGSSFQRHGTTMQSLIGKN